MAIARRIRFMNMFTSTAQRGLPDRRDGLFGRYRFLAVALILATWSCRVLADDPRNLDGGLALRGYDPVAYFEGRAMEGLPALSLTRDGATYRFASEAHRKAFEADPVKYEPAYGGWCAWAMYDSGEKVDVDPATFKVVNGRVYLFFNKYFINTLKSWDKAASKHGEAVLLEKADAAWAALPP